LWSNTTKIEVISYITKRSSPKRAKQLLRDCLDRIDELERANASFGPSMNTFMDQIPAILQQEMDRRALPTLPTIKELELTIEDDEPTDIDIMQTENDRIWGPGNWIRCPICPRDDFGNEIYHRKDAHE